MRKILSYVLTSIFGLIITVLVLVGYQTFTQTDVATIYKNLCDAFFIPGVCILGFGLLVLVSNGGVFDMIKFSFIKLFDLFRRDLTKVKYRTYYDYSQAQKEKSRGFGYLIVVGGAFMALAVLFLILCNNVA